MYAPPQRMLHASPHPPPGTQRLRAHFLRYTFRLYMLGRLRHAFCRPVYGRARTFAHALGSRIYTRTRSFGSCALAFAVRRGIQDTVARSSSLRFEGACYSHDCGFPCSSCAWMDSCLPATLPTGVMRYSPRLRTMPRMPPWLFHPRRRPYASVWTMGGWLPSLPAAAYDASYSKHALRNVNHGV